MVRRTVCSSPYEGLTATLCFLLLYILVTKCLPRPKETSPVVPRRILKARYVFMLDKEAKGSNTISVVISFQLTGRSEEALARAIFMELNDAWAIFEEEGSKPLY